MNGSEVDPPGDGESTACQLEVLSEDLVHETIDGDEAASFRKEILRADLGPQRKLALVRKRPETGPTRGAVILIHGFAQNRYSWHLSCRSLENFFAHQGLDTFNLELAGHGRSREFGTPPARSFNEYIDDCVPVIEAVANHSGSRQVFLVGHSLGGAVAYAVAPRCPEKIAGVITLGGVYSFGRNPFVFHAAQLLSRIDGRSGLVRRLGLGMKTSLFGKLLNGLLPLADDLSWHFPLAGWVPGSTEHEVIRERVERGFDWTGINVFLTMMGWAAEDRFSGEDGTDYAAAFAALDLPLLVVAGNEDRLATPDDVRPAYEHSRSTDKTYREFGPIDDEMHWGHLDIVLGVKASERVWPYLAQWMLQRSGSH
ncbi:MAG: alpha/beta hydrolase [Myxococcota bacterium]|nr:alpha/beta hydrolase [Myxococcota bacterium]